MPLGADGVAKEDVFSGFVALVASAIFAVCWTIFWIILEDRSLDFIYCLFWLSGRRFRLTVTDFALVCCCFSLAAFFPVFANKEGFVDFLNVVYGSSTEYTCKFNV